MYTISNPETFRKGICLKINEIIDNNTISKNLEISIFNYAIRIANDKNLVKKWSNPRFNTLYLDRLRSIMTNLENENFKNRIVNLEIVPQNYISLTHQEMNPDKWSTLIKNKNIRDANKYTPEIKASTEDFTCWKCKSNQCTYYQMQTRSADEAMTTFVSCLKCGQRWKC